MTVNIVIRVYRFANDRMKLVTLVVPFKLLLVYIQSNQLS